MRVPENMTWEETEARLKHLSSVFIALHNRPERDWEIHEKDLAKRMRAECIQLGEKRYSILRVQRKSGPGKNFEPC